MIRILFIGNMNDVMNSLRSWLPKNEYKHDLMEFSNVSDNFKSPFEGGDGQGVAKYEVNINPYYLFINRKKIKQILQSYDFIVGHNYAQALCSIANVKLDLLITHGGDLRNLSKYRYIIRDIFCLKCLVVKPFLLWLTLHQRKGSKLIKYLITNYWDTILLSTNDLNSTSGKLIQDLTPPYIRKKIESGTNFKLIKKIKKFEISVLCHARHEWYTKKLKPSNKGQDKLIVGWAKFINESKINGVLILLEYGKDVSHSKKLVNDLKINKNVLWLPKQKRENVFTLIKLVDLCVAETRVSIDQNSVHQEVLAMGKPLMTYKDIDKMPSVYNILNIKDDSIPNLLTNYVENKQKYIDEAKLNKMEYYKRVEKTIKYIQNNIFKK